MTPRRAVGDLFGSAVLAGLLACNASIPAAGSHQPDCPGFIAPGVISAPAVSLPATMASVVSVEMPGEVVVAVDGSVGETRMPGGEFAFLAPFTDQALKRTRFSTASIEGNAVAARVAVIVPVGVPGKARAEAAPPSLRAYVPGTESREARWQLRDTVERLTLVGHIGRLPPAGATIVAIAPNRAEKVILTVPPSAAPQEIRETVKTGKFLAAAGDYRLEVRAGANPLATTTVTIAEDYKQAVVNACEPVTVARKTGPGN